ncbi:MAG: sulfatase-like hydrolase/transferase, partial [Acutalibacteraceae bacterium]
GLAGFSTTDHPWLTGEGNFFTRLLGNLLLALPSVAALALTVVTVICAKEKAVFQRVFSRILSFVLVLTTVAFVLTMNLRSKPNVERMWEGHDDYLGKIDNNKTKSSSPNVLFIMMDDLGYGDISANGAIYDTPNIDRIADEGVQFVNFYSSYSVCSPSRFAALTGRYPYRGYADNVIYPTVDTISPFASTRIFNSVEMGANADGMLGDEITIAEVLKSAGYATGCFGKWHLGDYGEYLPTNQGFDYFYGSHHVNDMTPFYHVREENGEYEIVHGTDELKDQSNATKWIYEELNSWITGTVKNSDQPFFAYYATPWPHAPVFVGDEFKGASGMGTYVDCVTEFDYYLGQLFDSLEELGVMDDTIIIFTSDNGPALEGSVNDLRGGKYLAYEGGQKVPFLIRWGNNGGLFSAGSTVEESATLVDLFPTLIEMCDITGNGGEENFMPSDREIDGVSMIPAIKNHEVIHTYENPILHMKREDIKAIQYAIPTADILAADEYKDYDYDVLKNNEYLVFKYFKRIQNDNSAFFDKYRKNWLHILTDDVGENYNRTPTYPTIADEMRERLEEIAKDFKENRRGIVRS